MNMPKANLNMTSIYQKKDLPKRTSPFTLLSVASYIIDTVTTFEVECINNQYITIVAEFVALSYSCVS